jgi:class 3 adenylate cyclase/tetratricopeptide (TPR) repeat protein
LLEEHLVIAHVATWLHDLGLGQYVAAFEANEVDLQILPALTAADLRDLGVTSVGHRRMLLTAIAASSAPGNGAVSAAPSPAAPAAPVRAAEAERRQLSVLVCDLVGSTVLSQQLDPEDYRKLIRSFHDICLQQVAPFEGWIANFIGDCILTYFGWPRAHEDDPERAVRAGLALVRAIEAAQTPSGITMKVRVGIATGSVVVGDLIREGPAQEQSAVGIAPNLAAQLQALAQPGQVVVDGLTRRLLGTSFSVQSLGDHELEGIAQPVAAFAVTGERSADTRFDAHRGPELTHIVGREQELALLMERFARAQEGEGQAMLLVGEAGIGKSRLVRALLDACSELPHRLVRWQCSPYHTGSALWPMSQGLARAVGLNDMQHYGPLQMSPQMLRERTLELLVEQLLEMTEQQPLLLVVEDAQWIDPTTLELIERCLEKIDATRVFIVVTSRPDDQSGLAGHPSVTRLSLNRLRRASVEAIIAQLAGDMLNTQTQATIVAQSDGVPLFVEELTKAVLETGEAAIPASLHGSLMARLDRVPDVKEVAQLAACIGREFELWLLEAVAEKPQNVASAIDKLVSAELVFRVGERARKRFVFKHALVQEAAYESMLRSRQLAAHARIVQALERLSPDTLPQVLAQHASRARLTDKAIGWWQQAGSAALAKSAYREAEGYLGSAIALIQGQTDGVDRRAQHLELLMSMGQARIAANGYTSDATRDTFARAEELLEADTRFTAFGPRIRYGLWTASISVGELDGALRRATRTLAIAQADNTPDALLCAHRMVALSNTYLGHLATAREHFETSLPLLKAVNHEALTTQLGWHPASGTFSSLAWLLCMQGHAAQSKELSLRAHEVVATLPQVSARAYPHMHGLMRAACAGDDAAVASDAEVLVHLATQHGMTFYKDFAELFRSWTAVRTSHPSAKDIRVYEQKLARTPTLPLFMPIFIAGLAQALAIAGPHDEAVRAIEQALEQPQAVRGWYHAELWRIRGEIVQRNPLGDQSYAEHCFEKALTISRGQGAKLWELRAATRLAGLRAERGDRSAALHILAAVYEWFDSGLATADLAPARALLRSLDYPPLAADR